MKWVPALLWPVLQPRARGWGLVFLALFALLSLAMLPITIVQLQVLFGFGTRPARVDYLVFIWAAVPWWWRHRDPFAFLRPSLVARGGRVPARSRAPLVGVVPRRPSGRHGPRLAAAAGRCPTDRRARGPTATRPLRRRRDPGPGGGRPGRPGAGQAAGAGSGCSRSGAAGRGGSTTGRNVIAARPIEDHAQREHDPRTGSRALRPA